MSGLTKHVKPARQVIEIETELYGWKNFDNNFDKKFKRAYRGTQGRTDQATCAKDRAIAVAERVLAAIKEPLYLDGHRVEISASLGVALYPEHGMDELSLTTHSDAAMYEAKRQNWAVLYQPEMGEGKSEAVVLKGELCQAISDGQMVLHYQPQVEFSTQYRDWRRGFGALATSTLGPNLFGCIY